LDTIVKQNWILELTNLYDIISNDHRFFIISGFNSTRHSEHYIIEEKDSYYLKNSIGGLNMFFSKDTYENVIKNTLISIDWEHNVVKKLKKCNGIIACCKPSVVNHTGMYGLWSKGENDFDTSIDF